jgi:hypothetical protein
MYRYEWKHFGSLNKNSLVDNAEHRSVHMVKRYIRTEVFRSKLGV